MGERLSDEQLREISDLVNARIRLSVNSTDVRRLLAHIAVLEGDLKTAKHSLAFVNSKCESVVTELQRVTDELKNYSRKDQEASRIAIAALVETNEMIVADFRTRLVAAVRAGAKVWRDRATTSNEQKLKAGYLKTAQQMDDEAEFIESFEASDHERN